ncbi:Cut8 six-helix bundle-domain-containing protein [Chytridium lagenaria]|nr:Cut8 six-helix bundle-domain-containing protein [Chytridium lagenaria]
MASPQVLPVSATSSPSRTSYLSVSSRKRKNAADADDVVMGQSSGGGSPEMPHRFATPTKRIKTYVQDNSPSPSPSHDASSSSSSTFPVARLLETLSKDDLLSMLVSLMSQHPSLENSVASLLPRPTLSSATLHLQQLFKALEAAFPYSRWGPDRSDYAFNRVRSNLHDLLEAFSHYLTHFTEPSMYPDAITHEYPANAFAFLRLCSQMAATLPVWSSDHHNSICRDLAYTRISKAWKIAVQEIQRRIRDEGRMFPATLIAEWARDLTAESQNLKGAFGFADALQDFTSRLGWAIGLNAGPAYAEASSSQFSFFPMMTGHLSSTPPAVSAGGLHSYRS